MSGSLRPRIRLTLAARCQARRRRPPVPITRAHADARRRHTKTKPPSEAAHPIWVRRGYPPASLTDLMASQRTTARARSAIAPTHIGRKESGRQNEPGTAPADAELSCHDPDVPGRASLPLAARRLVGRMMEVFAGFLTQADHQAGRPIEFLPQLGELDTGGPRSSPATA